MPGPKAIELRECVVRAIVIYGLHERDVRRLYNVSRNTIRRYLELARTRGSVAPRNDAPRGRPRVLSAEHVEFLRSLLDLKPDWYLMELQDEMMIRLGKPVNISAIVRTMERIGTTYKKLSVQALERNEMLRIAFMHSMRQIPAEMLVFLDETSKDERTRARRYGYSAKGWRAFMKAPFVRGRRFTATAAIASTGLIAHHIIEASSNADYLLQFVTEKLIPSMNPVPLERSILVMDNCIIHHNQDVLIALQTAGITVRFLPPYSPDLNPIESAFSATKFWIRNNREWVNRQQDPGWVLEMALVDSLNAKKTEAYIRHSGYRFADEE